MHLFFESKQLPSLVAIAGGIAIAATFQTLPAHAAAVDFSASPWESIGNVNLLDPQSPVLSTTGAATALPPGNDLQQFLGLGVGDLDTTVFDIIPSPAFEGSALRVNVNAGDQISFEFSTDLDATNPFGTVDYAFVVIDGVVEQLTSPGTFTRTFANSGLFGIGIVDTSDTLGDSTLTLSNSDFTPVPTPALLPGLIGMGVATVRRRKRQDSKVA